MIFVSQVSFLCCTLSTMADKTSTKLFETVRSFFERMGAYSPKSTNPYHQCTNSNFVFFFIINDNNILFTDCVLLKSSSIVDYGIAFCGSITMLCALGLLITLVWQMENVIKFIEQSEKLIALSK